MTVDAAKALQYETEFLSGVDANLEGAKGKLLRGSIWQRARHDETDHLRALMAKNRMYDRTMLRNLPANRRVALHGYDRRMLFWKRLNGVAIASTISPLNHYVDPQGADAPPIGLGELADHVRKLVGDQKVPHVIGVCSPSGFTSDAKEAGLDYPGVSLVLIEPDGHGGWSVTPTADDVDEGLVKLFDPEGFEEKIIRVRNLMDERSADLLTGGLSASSIAEKANLPEHVVRLAFEQVADANPELRLTTKQGACLLYRGAPVQSQEKKSMNVIDRIRKLFSGEGDETEKINVLAERRAALAQRRDRIYEDIGKLEKKEAELLAEGKAAKSQVPRRRLAAQLAQVRKDVLRHNTTASMLNQQMNVLSTDIHNLTLIQQGEMASLPDTHELTENAVKAEEMLETLKADSELIGTLEAGMQDVSTSEEELAILQEFEQTDEPVKEADSATPAQQQRPEEIEDRLPPEPESNRKSKGKEGDAEAM